MRSRAFGCALVPVVLSASIAPSEEPPTLPRFVDSVETRIANIDVYVADKDGVPVSGLQRTDFALFLDGKQRPITNFLAIGECGGEPSPSTETAPAVEAIPQPRLRLIVAVDVFNLERIGGNWVYKQILDFLSRQGEGAAEIAVVALTSRMDVRCPPTTDTGRVLAALEAMRKEAPQGLLFEVNKKMALDNIAEARSPEEKLGIARAYAMEVANRGRQSINALRAAITAFAAPRGRTVLLYLTDGFQVRAGEDVFDRVVESVRSPGEVLAEQQSFDLSHDLEELVATANALGVTVYGFEAAGLKPPPMSVADSRTSTPASLAFMEQHTRRDPLERLPAATGGLTVTGRNIVTSSLEHMAEDFRCYYWLGFEAEATDADAPGRIDVKVDRPGVKVRHRTSFRRLSPQEQMANGVTAVLNGVTPSNPLAVTVTVGKPEPVAGQKTVKVGLTITIPSQQLALVPQGDTASGRIELAATAADGHGRTVPPFVQAGTVTLPVAALAAGAPVTIPFAMVLRPEPTSVALAIRDASGGEPSYVLIEVGAAKTR